MDIDDEEAGVVTEVIPDNTAPRDKLPLVST